MIFADKIIEERKRNGWSQEELADKLQVSRQSVSKWESAQSIPDINRILQLAELFGVSTDYLLKDTETRPGENGEIMESVEGLLDVRKVSMEEANQYLSFQEKFASLVAMAVSLCVLSPVVLIILAGFSDDGVFGVSENLAAGVGVITLLLMVAVAVYIFIRYGMAAEKYDYLEKSAIDTEYGVAGMVREKKNSYQEVYSKGIAIGVIMCVLSVIPLLISAFVSAPDYIVCSMVGVLLTIIAIAVHIFVRVGMIKGSFDHLLEEGDYSVRKKKKSPVIEGVATIFWLLATAIYLGFSFATERWESTWIVWPIAGVLFGVVITIAKMIIKDQD